MRPTRHHGRLRRGQPIRARAGTRRPGAGSARRRPLPKRTTDRCDLRDLNAFYGDSPRSQGNQPLLRRQRCDGDHRPLGLRQVDDGRAASTGCTRRSPAHGRRARSSSTASTSTGTRRRRRRGAPRGRHGLPEAQPVPDHVDLRQRRLRPAASPAAAHEIDAGTGARARCVGASLWDEVKDRLGKPGAGPLGGPAAAALHRPRACSRARGAADGRALLGARPGGDAGDRGADRRAEEASDDRDRHPQHAAGRAGRRHDRLLHARRRARRGRIGPTEKLFTNPDDERTEHYVTGKFG